MTYKDVNPDRLKWLIRNALTPAEVSRFLKEKRNPLIMKSVKIDNLPADYPTRVAVIQRLPDDAAPIFGAWLRTQLSEGESIYQGQLVAWFTSIEANGLLLPEKEIRSLARAGLKELFADDASAEWLAYLRSEISDRSPKAEELVEAKAAPDPLVDREAVTRDLRGFASWALGLSEEPDIQSTELAGAVRLVNMLRSSSADAPPPSPFDAAEWNELLGYKRAVDTNHPTSLPLGFRTIPPTIEPFDPGFDYTQLEAICIPSRTPGSGPWFLDVLGFLRDREVLAIGGTALLDALPEEGRVIVHINSGLAAPSPGVAECFRIEKYRSTKPIKVRATARTSRLLPVMYVPHASSDPDGVRGWVVDRAAQISSRPSLLVLSDGVAIKARDDAGTLIATSQFEWAFDRWNAMTGVELGQNAYVLLPLPKPDEKFECPPVSVFAKRLFKSFSDTRELGVTRAQLTRIAQRLEDPELPMLPTYRERVAKGVLALADAETEYEALVSELMRSPAVQRDISALKAKRFAELESETKSERSKLENLQKATQQQQERLEKLKEQTDERVRETKAAVKRAFETAREKESNTIGELALWKELLGTAGTERVDEVQIGAPMSSAPTTPDRARVRIEECTHGDVATVFRTVGLQEEVVRLYSLACLVAKSSRATIMVSGGGARYLSLALARVLSVLKVSVVDIGLGCITPDLVRECLLDPRTDVLLIRGIDLSDPALFAPDLIDLVVERITLPPRAGDQKLILLCRSSGPASLSLPAELEQLSLKVDLDGGSAQTESPLPDSIALSLRRKLRSRVKALVEEQVDAADLAERLTQLI